MLVSVDFHCLKIGVSFVVCVYPSSVRMYKTIVFAALFAAVFSSPLPEANPVPEAKAQVIVNPYVADIAPVAPLAYAGAPIAYSDYVVPSVYAPGYAYSPYLAADPVVVV
ncbi:uncharacterized protein LOC143203507 [Rhynchophorus ferrugineus]|uniref:uncharacterized protein LOC143203507 n=1 Tax=Rhynchophorus ferrugineus TaxID=354439 RepID=UPI003FCCE423